MIWRHIFAELEKCLPLQSSHLAIVSQPEWSELDANRALPREPEDGENGFTCPNALRLDEATLDVERPAQIDEEVLTVSSGRR